ncbi:MAG: YciI family protein [Acidobacteriota bacterium]|nr:YciI family protein [Acidobacteriota bacterium]
MTTYVIGFLRKGPNSGQGSKEESAQIQNGHLANIRKMAATGKLIVAGPMGDDTDLRGLFIFKAKSPDEVRQMAKKTQPSKQAA